MACMKKVASPQRLLANPTRSLGAMGLHEAAAAAAPAPAAAATPAVRAVSATLPALWPHLTKRSRQALRLCCTTLRCAVDSQVVSLAPVHGPTLPLSRDATKTAALRWPHVHSLALHLTCGSHDGALLAPVNAGAFPKLQQLSLHLVAPVALPYSLAGLHTSALSCIVHLRISNCSQPLDLTAVAHTCPNLRTLEVRRCPTLLDLSPLSPLAGTLQHLSLVSTRLHSTVPLATLTRLCTLDLSCSATSRHSGLDLAPLSSCTRLSSLTASRCTLQNLNALATLTTLTHLDFNRCGTSLTNLSFASRLTKLTHLNLASCHSLTSLAPLGAALHSLTSLDVSFCWGLADLAPLATSTNLHTLAASGCPNITSLQPLAPCVKLMHVDVSLCTALVDISILSSWAFTSLERLYVNGSPVVMDDADVARLVTACPRLRVLHLKDGDGGDEDEDEGSDDGEGDEGSDASDYDLMWWDEAYY